MLKAKSSSVKIAVGDRVVFVRDTDKRRMAYVVWVLLRYCKVEYLLSRKRYW